MRQGRRSISPCLLAGGEQAEQLSGLEWGSALVGERLIAAARLATAMHMAADVEARLEAGPESVDANRRSRS
jgi:hypothetical protein